MTVRTRFASSPTGSAHWWIAHSAFLLAYARRHQGKFILRIEDTDLERSTAEAIQQILDGMEWAGLDHDGRPFYQTQRVDRYEERSIEQLLAQGHAYRCYCTKEELDQTHAEQMARGKNPATMVAGASVPMCAQGSRPRFASRIRSRARSWSMMWCTGEWSFRTSSSMISSSRARTAHRPMLLCRRR